MIGKVLRRVLQEEERTKAAAATAPAAVIPISWAIDERAILRTLTLDDADVVFRAVDDNRDRLRPYMPWEQTTRSPADVRAFIERSLASVTDREANGIWVGERVRGERRSPGRRGDARRRARVLERARVRGARVDHEGVPTAHRVRVRRASAPPDRDPGCRRQRRSRAVAERLGFTFEASSMRDGHRHPDGTYVDQVVYGLLEHEWPAP